MDKEKDSSACEQPIQKRSLSFSEKIAVIREKEKGITMKNLAENYGCSKSQIQKILASKEKYLTELAIEEENEKKSIRKQARMVILEAAVHEWIQRTRNHGQSIEDSEIADIAFLLSQIIDLEEFEPTDLWLQLVKKKFNIDNLDPLPFVDADTFKASLNIVDILFDMKNAKSDLGFPLLWEHITEQLEISCASAAPAASSNNIDEGWESEVIEILDDIGESHSRSNENSDFGKNGTEASVAGCQANLMEIINIEDTDDESNESYDLENADDMNLALVDDFNINEKGERNSKILEPHRDTTVVLDLDGDEGDLQKNNADRGSESEESEICEEIVGESHGRSNQSSDLGKKGMEASVAAFNDKNGNQTNLMEIIKIDETDDESNESCDLQNANDVNLALVDDFNIDEKTERNSKILGPRTDKGVLHLDGDEEDLRKNNIDIGSESEESEIFENVNGDSYGRINENSDFGKNGTEASVAGCQANLMEISKVEETDDENSESYDLQNADDMNLALVDEINIDEKGERNNKILGSHTDTTVVLDLDGDEGDLQKNKTDGGFESEESEICEKIIGESHGRSNENSDFGKHDSEASVAVLNDKHGYQPNQMEMIKTEETDDECSESYDLQNADDMNLALVDDNNIDEKGERNNKILRTHTDTTVLDLVGDEVVLQKNYTGGSSATEESEIFENIIEESHGRSNENGDFGENGAEASVAVLNEKHGYQTNQMEMIKTEETDDECSESYDLQSADDINLALVDDFNIDEKDEKNKILGPHTDTTVFLDFDGDEVDLQKNNTVALELIENFDIDKSCERSPEPCEPQRGTSVVLDFNDFNEDEEDLIKIEVVFNESDGDNVKVLEDDLTPPNSVEYQRTTTEDILVLREEEEENQIEKDNLLLATPGTDDCRTPNLKNVESKDISSSKRGIEWRKKNSISSNTKLMPIISYRDAIRRLEPLENFVTTQNNIRAAAIINQLEKVFIERMRLDE